jgi:ABC-type lipoprotein release transport system permease subunit
MEEFIVQRGGLSKMRLHLDLGATMVEASGNEKAPPRRIEGVLLGIRDKAIPIGITVPICYVERWNREFLGEEAATTYSSIVVRLENKDDVGPFSAWVESDEVGLRLQDSQGQQFAMVIFVITLFFLLISLVIVTISAINIAHNFFMQVSERRREIGLLRAVGASQADVRGIFLGEAALIGLLAGILGVGVAVAVGIGVNLVGRQFLPELPFVFSVLFCLLGGFMPARKAARMAPAQALAQQ